MRIYYELRASMISVDSRKLQTLQTLGAGTCYVQILPQALLSSAMIKTAKAMAKLRVLKLHVPPHESLTTDSLLALYSYSYKQAQ